MKQRVCVRVLMIHNSFASFIPNQQQQQKEPRPHLSLFPSFTLSLALTQEGKITNCSFVLCTSSNSTSLHQTHSKKKDHHHTTARQNGQKQRTQHTRHTLSRTYPVRLRRCYCCCMLLAAGSARADGFNCVRTRETVASVSLAVYTNFGENGRTEPMGAHAHATVLRRRACACTQQKGTATDDRAGAVQWVQAFR